MLDDVLPTKARDVCWTMCYQHRRETFGARLRDAAREANTKYDVDGLCRDFPSRIADLKARSGDRLGK